MSGTSMDGIDAALIETDGESQLTLGPHTSVRYPTGLREMLLRLPMEDVDVASLEREVTARLPRLVKDWIVVGGGRLNEHLLAELRHRLAADVRAAEEVGWMGDAIEAQAFGYLAARSLMKLPLSWPGTTGVSAPVNGGVRWDPVAPQTQDAAVN